MVLESLQPKFVFAFVTDHGDDQFPVLRQHVEMAHALDLQRVICQLFLPPVAICICFPQGSVRPMAFSYSLHSRVVELAVQKPRAQRAAGGLSAGIKDCSKRTARANATLACA